MTEKQKALESALAQVKKQHGEDSIMRLGDAQAYRKIDVIPSGILSIDRAFGVGGLPKGRVVEIFGPESSGKTTLALQVIASAQKSDGLAAFIDVEHALDPTYAKALGVQLDDLVVSQPDCGEQALEIVELLIRSNAFEIIVIDSVAALTPRAEINGEMGDSHVGLQARLMSQALRKITSCVSRSNCTLVFINQLRSKIGVMYGSNETTTGGNALKFYASMRIDVRRIGAIKSGADIIGNRTRLKVVKNKVAPPFQETEVEIYYGSGISRIHDIIELGITHDLIQKSGSWYSYQNERLGQGKDRVINFLNENAEILHTIEASLKQKLFQHPDDESSEKSSEVLE